MIIKFDENRMTDVEYTHNHLLFDEPISIKTAQGKFYYLFDGLGSVTGLTDSNGNLVSSYSYDAFGNIVSETGNAILNAINPYRFTSRVYDKEIGLYYYRARYYDAKDGRFISKDPLRSELTEGKNLYVYVGNNPVNRVDPSGLGWVKWLEYKICFWGWCRRVKYGVEVWWKNSELDTLCSVEVSIGIEIAKTLLSIVAGATLSALIIITLGIVGAMCLYHLWGCRWIYLRYIFFALMPIPLAKW